MVVLLLLLLLRQGSKEEAGKIGRGGNTNGEHCSHPVDAGSHGAPGKQGGKKSWFPWLILSACCMRPVAKGKPSGDEASHESSSRYVVGGDEGLSSITTGSSRSETTHCMDPENRMLPIPTTSSGGSSSKSGNSKNNNIYNSSSSANTRYVVFRLVVRLFSFRGWW